MADRMPGRVAASWCPHCHSAPGPDCLSRARSTRQLRRRLAIALRREVEEELTTTVTGS